ncbi:MAG TPA: hypothetical protein DCR21_05625 [Succinivibrionaceae bacterium]|nr:hypothetical protein [Succinivibrionaceae bacterium]
MWFKNARIYDVDFKAIKEIFSDPETLEKSIENNARFKSCKQTSEVASIGFVPLFGNDTPYFFSNGSSFFFKLVEENKLLPASVIRTELNEQVAAKEAELKRGMSKQEKETLKTAVTSLLLSKAFTTRREMLMWCNTELNLCAVAVSSAKRAEKALAMMRQALGSFPATLPEAKCVVEDRMTNWVSKNQLPEKFELGTDTTLKSLEEDGGIIRASKEDLTSTEIAAHFDAGKVITDLQLIYDNSLLFVLSNDLSLKRMKPLDQYLEKNLPEKTDDAIADQQSHLILQGELLSEIISRIERIFDCEH